MRDIVGRYYDVKFLSEGEEKVKEIRSLEELTLHDIRLELYNDYKNISELKIVTSGFIKGDRY